MVATRDRFVRIAAATLVAVAGSGRAPVRAAVVRAGPYCSPSKAASLGDDYDFRLPTLDGGDVHFGALSGSPLWLNFFASWCAPCNREAAVVERLARRHAAAGLVVVGIDVGETPEVARAFRDRHALTFPIGLDLGGAVFRALGFDAYPTHAFFDEAGRMTCCVAGGLDENEMANEIAVAFAAPPQARPRR